MNIEKQTTPIETSVAARDIFEHENDYKEYLEKLKKTSKPWRRNITKFYIHLKKIFQESK